MNKRNSISRFLQRKQDTPNCWKCKNMYANYLKITRSPKALPQGSTHIWLVMHSDKWYHSLNIVCSKFTICDFFLLPLLNETKWSSSYKEVFESIFPSCSSCWSADKMSPDEILNELIQLVNVPPITGWCWCVWVSKHIQTIICVHGKFL